MTRRSDEVMHYVRMLRSGQLAVAYKIQACERLAAYGKDAIPARGALIEHLEHDTPSVRWAATRALCELQRAGVEVVMAVQQLLKNAVLPRTAYALEHAIELARLEGSS